MEGLGGYGNISSGEYNPEIKGYKPWGALGQAPTNDMNVAMHIAVNEADEAIPTGPTECEGRTMIITVLPKGGSGFNMAPADGKIKF